MKIVVDTNILFSALLSEHSKFRQLLMSSDNQYYAPLEILEELFRHFDKLSKYTSSSPENLQSAILLLFSKINFIDQSIISNATFKKAYELCKEYYEKDTPFVALALELDTLYWTGDKIKEHLKSQGFTKLFEI